MRLRSALALLLLAGCTAAPAGSAPAASAPATIRATAEGFEIQSSGTGSASAYRISAPPQQVWSAVVKFYGDHGVPFTVFDPASFTAGNQGLAVRRRWAGMPVSAILDCGAVAGAPIADTYPVRMSLVVSLAPAGNGGTQVRIQTGGTATNPAASSRPVQCATTGRLEERILETLRNATQG